MIIHKKLIFLKILIVLFIFYTKYYICFFFFINKAKWCWNKLEGKNFRVYVSRPAQKKSNQLKTKIIINKRKKEENAKSSIRKNDYKSSSQYKLIEELINEYPQKLAFTNIKDQPFILLKDKLNPKYIKGYELPFNLINPIKYELLKLIGKICDPFKPLCCYSLTPKLFIDKMFKDKRSITYNDFCYNIEYKFKFYMPSYTEIFKFEKELLWKLYMTVRNLKEVSPYTPLNDHERVNKILEDNETTLPITISKVNKEMNRQGIHPSILKMFFDFLNIEKINNILKRDNAFLKLESIKNQIKNRDLMEGIRPDYLYIMFSKNAKEYYSNFNHKQYEKEFLNSINYNTTTQKLITENSIYKKKRKQFSQETKTSLMKFYDIQLPSFFKEYIKKKDQKHKEIYEKIKKMIHNKYLKRKQKREDKLAGKIYNTQSQSDAKTNTNEDDKKKKKKKKKKK
ncbi:conserved Plasmodium protein, unknown function [Plasmodium reichenowi]|uniref:Uncharacterized protein n=1 Tax=Plasmodium reichenowi TaxID=5854 RepID=A0A2P9DBT6_PLARE|nr:conserved Plasmodium protein, unknown function [Plasmodium reichenowi]